MAKSTPRMSTGLMKLDTPDAIIVSSMGFKTNKLKAPKAQKKIVEDSEKAITSPIERLPEKPSVHLYIELTNIANMPRTENEVELVLQLNKTKLERVEEHYTGCSSFYLRDIQSRKPVYSMPIYQDSMEDINSFSDNPLLITLFEHVLEPVSQRSDSSLKSGSVISKNIEGRQVSYVDRLVPIAQGVIDVLSMFSQQRSSNRAEIFLYPVDQDCSADHGTCKTEWHLYTLLPLLKDINFANMVFITFESIYNAPPDIMSLAHDLIAEILVRSRNQDDSTTVRSKTICTFSRFLKDTIANQDNNIKWEAARNVYSQSGSNLGLHTGQVIQVHNLFHHLLCTEGVDFKFREIDIHSEESILCNSMHRYIINHEMKSNLEDMTARNEYELVLRIYRKSERDEILLEGSLNPQVFLYPMVNAVRFAVALSRLKNDKQSVVPKKEVAEKSQPKKAARKSLRSKTVVIEDPLATGDSITSFNKDRPIFAILSICLLNPITEITPMGIKKSEIQTQSDALKACKRMTAEYFITTKPEEAYKDFDDIMRSIIHQVIDQPSKSVDDSKEHFCCQLNNVSNRILKLIGVDFNRRIPTKNNIEFTRLMTTVYKELIERCYHLVQACGESGSSNLSVQHGYPKDSGCQRLFTIAKYMYETGDSKLGDFFMNKVKTEFANNPELSFYLLLYNVEERKFGDARNYMENIKLERMYFVDLITIYIDYLQSIETEDAQENLCESLRKLAFENPQQIDVYILLHCLYKKSNYSPGVEYTRWRFENLYDFPPKQLHKIPISLWRIYLNYDIAFNTKRSEAFFRAIRLFSDLGAYHFAEIIFDNIKSECSESDAYMFSSTLSLLIDQDKPEVLPRSVLIGKNVENAEKMRAFQAQVNGNLQFHRGNFEAAMNYFESIVSAEGLYDFRPFELSLLRYAHYKASLEEPQYEAALKAYELYCAYNDKCPVVKFLMSRVLYKLGRLEDARTHLSESTEYGVHMPDVWAYLALINLKLGNNFLALECWKYAKRRPETVISDDILDELAKIDLKDVCLFVDKPTYA